MKLIILLSILSITSSFGSGQKWTWTYLPLHVLNVDEGENTQIVKVEFVTSGENAQIIIMNREYIPPTVSYEKPRDTNLITLYGIQISLQPQSGIDIKSIKKGTITIDSTKAIRPKHYPYTIEQVVEIVSQCVKKNFNSNFYDIKLKVAK